jgi:hypothetical protein
MNSKFRIFISHDKADETLAVILKNFLENVFLNAEVFVSSRDLKGGEIWIKEIREQLQTSAIIISLITRISWQNLWVHFESGAGLVDRKTIPVCADSVTVDTLRPPLSLLQARNFDEDGLKNLVQDISKIVELRAPSEYPGLKALLKSASEFISLRNEAGSESSEDTETPVEATEISDFELPEPDPDISQKVVKVENRLREVLIKQISWARENYNVPSNKELDKMDIFDVSEVARYFNIPFPHLLLIQILTIRMNIPSKQDSKWKKLNTLKSIEDIDKEITKIEKTV